jgi:tetratricopeptide (TPR) repeat protein
MNLNHEIVIFTEPIRLDPNFAEAYNNRGVACYAKGKYDRAVADYNQAIALNPHYVLAYYNRGPML